LNGQLDALRIHCSLQYYEEFAAVDFSSNVDSVTVIICNICCMFIKV